MAAASAMDVAGALREGSAPSRRHGARAATTTAVLAIVVTGLLSFGAWKLNDRNEDRLLRQQVRQAGSALTTGIQSLQAPLETGAASARVGGTDAFSSVMTPLVGDGRQFAAAALWMVGSPAPVVALGDPKLAHAPAQEVLRFLAQAGGKPHLSIEPMLTGDPARLGYAYDDVAPTGTYVAYAEGQFATDRTHMQRRSDAYRNVEYALYMSTQERTQNLIAASTARLPITGRRAPLVTPFGNSSLLLVMTPKANLGGWLSGNLWWIVLLVGLAIGAGAVTLVGRLARRRDDAIVLVGEVARLYEEQRGIAVTLQRALLPDRVPTMSGVEIATRYEPAATHTEVGGDWYDVLQVGDSSLLLIVGDVSGHGVAAATAMASLRYAARAFVSEGNGPSQIIAKLDKILDLDDSGQFATIICARIDFGSRTMTVANAGHPDILVVDDNGPHPAGSTPGLPVGLGHTTRSEAVIPIKPTGTLLAFTDGLFERRGESVDVGLGRVRDALTADAEDLDTLLDRTIAEVVPGVHGDDIAMVGVRWTVPVRARGAA